MVQLSSFPSDGLGQDPARDRAWDRILRLFEEPTKTSTLLHISQELHRQYREALQRKGYCMVPSYHCKLPTGGENGKYFALDFGGSVLRLAVVELNGQTLSQQESYRISSITEWIIDEQVKASAGDAFFDWVAAKMEVALSAQIESWPTQSAPLPIGLAWSFPVKYEHSLALLIPPPEDRGAQAKEDASLTRLRQIYVR